MSILNKLRDPGFWTERCVTDLYFLCRNVLQTLEDPTPGYKDLYYPTHKRVCDFIQTYGIEGQKLLILLPRNWLKSYIITVGWVIQRMLQNWIAGKREHTIISNATIGNSKNFLEKIKYNLKYNELLTGLFRKFIPVDLENDAERWTQDEIQIGGNRIETGSVEGNLVSRHYFRMINDDLVNWENSRTAEQLAKVVDWWRLARSLLLPRGIEINIGTRWHFDDVYGHIIDRFIKPKKDYHLGKPIIELHRNNYHLLQMDCWEDAEKETGSTFPILFPEWKLKELQAEQEDEFNGQYRNDPLAKGKNKYKRKWIQYWQEGQVPDVVNTVMLLDVTDKVKKTSDYTGMVVADIGVDKYVYIRKGERRKITDADLIDWMIEEACRWQPATIGVESMKYNTLVELLELLLPRKFEMGEIPEAYREYVKTLPYIMYELKHRGRPKQIRIENMAGQVQRGTVLFPKNGADHLIDELIRLGSSLIDDTADAFGYLQDILVYPTVKDFPKVYIVPEELRKTQEQREREEWESLKGEEDYDGLYSQDGFYDEITWY